MNTTSTKIGRTRAAKARKTLRADAAKLENYWLAGVWDAEGKLLWSSEPTSFDSREGALSVARIQRDWLAGRYSKS